MISIPGLNVYSPLWTHIPPRASRNALSCCSSRKKMQGFCPLLLFPYLCLLDNTCTNSAQIVFSFFPILQQLCILFSSRSSVFPRKTASGNVHNVHTAVFCFKTYQELPKTHLDQFKGILWPCWKCSLIKRGSGVCEGVALNHGKRVDSGSTS